jgi:hypothetical protein
MTWKTRSHSDSVNMNQVMNMLDEKSVQILIYLAKERHAGIRKLADLIDASFDMEVLVKIREEINAKARKTTGRPLVIFKPSKLDPLTGEKITFSWWLNEELIDYTPGGELLDLHDENDTLRETASIPLQKKDVEAGVRDNFLIIVGKKYCGEVLLTDTVEGKVKKTINNGFLEVVLKKSGEKTW